VPRRRLALAAAALALAWAAVAVAQEGPRRVALQVLVAYISDQAGGVDPRAERLHAELADQFRYETLRVLDQRRLDLPLGVVESLELPNGKLLNLRAFQLSSRGVLLGVTVKGSLQTDLRIPNGHLVVIGAEGYQDGKLVISLEPSW
jgi:hypothetical protein